MSNTMKDTDDREYHKKTYYKAFQSRQDARDIMWTDIVDVAKSHWEWVVRQPNARTGSTEEERRRNAGFDVEDGTCLVAALFVPCRTGGYFFLSTIPRGSKQSEMRKYGYQVAKAWWTAVDRVPQVVLHAEDAVEYDFEQAMKEGDIQVPHIQILQDEHKYLYFNVRESRDAEAIGPLRMAVYGCYGTDSASEQRYGRLIESCRGALAPKKNPGCRTVAERLNIRHCTQQKLNEEIQRLQRPSSSGRGAQSGAGAGSGSTGGSRHSSSERPSGSSRPTERPSGSSRPTERLTERPSGSSRPTERPTERPSGSSRHSERPSGSSRHSERPSGGGGSSVSHLTGRMASVSVSPPKSKASYWTYSDRDKQYYHRHSDGAVSWSRTGRD